MTLRKTLLGLFVGFGISAAAVAQAPAGVPAGSTGICKDGTYSTQASKQGACRGHKGIQTWYEASATTPAAPAAAKPSATTPAAKAMPAPAAQASGPAPSGATGMCKDGTYSMQASKQGACRGHQGIQTWFAASAAPAPAPTPAAKAMPASAPAPAAKAMPAASPAPAPKAMPAPAPAAMPAPAPAAATPGKRLSPTQAAAQKPQAAGGGPGLVWVNTETKVYHCNGDAFYGKTKVGAYMSEDAAKAQGARPERNKPCTGK